MKIALVGKGGSGKSSLSWLFGNYLADNGNLVLSVDADHNMDLTYAYGIVVDHSTKTLHRTVEEFRVVLDHPSDKKWLDLLPRYDKLPHFSLSQPDDYSKIVTQKLSSNHNLMIVGLGADDILHSNKCAHAHIAPLKFYLPLLETKKFEYVVIDGVAGVDMMNYGLYLGADLIIGVVEPHQNSIRVYEEVRRIAQLSNIPTRFITNIKSSRYSDIDVDKILNEQSLATFIADSAVRDFDYQHICEENLNNAEKLMFSVNDIKREDTVQRLKRFEMNRLTHVS